MKKFLILSLLFIAAPTYTQNNNNDTDAGAPGKIDKGPSTSEEPTQGAQSSYNFEGGIGPIPNPFSPDGTKVATYWRPESGITAGSAYPKSYLYIWDTSNGSLISKFELDEYSSLIAWHPGSKMIISGKLSKSTLWKIPN